MSEGFLSYISTITIEDTILVIHACIICRIFNKIWDKTDGLIAEYIINGSKKIWKNHKNNRKPVFGNYLDGENGKYEPGIHFGTRGRLHLIGRNNGRIEMGY